MNFSINIQNDIDRVLNALQPFIKHAGIFGSVARGTSIDLAGDLDLLLVYETISYSDILQVMSDLELNNEYFCSYLNYSSIISLKNTHKFYFDFLFMPKNKPNREFMRQHEEKIIYLSSPFTSWKIENKSHNKSLQRTGRSAATLTRQALVASSYGVCECQKRHHIREQKRVTLGKK